MENDNKTHLNENCEVISSDNKLDTPPDITGEKQGGRFIKGQSGNPSGRPPGALNNTTKVAMALLDGEAEAITRIAIDLALSGDMQAIKLILERALPVRKDRPINLDLPPIKNKADITEANKKVAVAVLSGEITTSEGQNFMAFLDKVEKALMDSSFNHFDNHAW